MTKFYKFKCGRCGTIFIADTTRHRMDNCPKCGPDGPAIDLEESYCRYILDKEGNQMEMIEQWSPPWFEDEDEYHSAFTTWLNDSDEEYRLSKEDKILLVRNMRKNDNPEEEE